MTLKRRTGRAHVGRRDIEPQPSADTAAEPETPATPVALDVVRDTEPERSAPAVETATTPDEAASATTRASTSTTTEEEVEPTQATPGPRADEDEGRTTKRVVPSGKDRANGANTSGRFAVSWQDDELDTLRAVYDYAYLHPDFARDVSTSVSDYLADILMTWVKVPARRRKTLMDNALASQRAGGNKPRSYAMPEDVFLAVDRARADDAALQDRFVARSAFARGALAHMRLAAEAHNGHRPLPIPPDLRRRGPRTDPRPAF